MPETGTSVSGDPGLLPIRTPVSDRLNKRSNEALVRRASRGDLSGDSAHSVTIPEWRSTESDRSKHPLVHDQNIAGKDKHIW